jgi:hypothetical protein
MAVFSGTTTKYDSVGLREQLAEAISMISPTETPFMSSCGTGAKAGGTLVEWQTDALRTAAANAQIEGDEYTFSTATATVRVGNYCQISRGTYLISGTLEAVDKAGRDSEIAYQRMKVGKELKRDQEVVFLRAQAGVAGSAGVARTLAGLNAWVKTNVDKHAAGGNPTYTSGVPAAVRTDGTLRAFTETILKSAISSCWTSGAEPKVLMVGPINKDRVSGFSGIATRNFDLSNTSPKPTAIIGAADVYVSNFGAIRVVPNRFQREQDGWLLDFDFLAVRYLRPYFEDKGAKTGDAEKRAILAEYTLEVKNEAALGLCADLTTT